MSQKSHDTSKTRFCVDCNVPVFVPRNSVLKRCKKCVKVWNASKQVEWYSEKPRESRQRQVKLSRVRREENPEARLLSYSKKSSKARGLDHEITIEDIHIPEVCPILQCPMVFCTPYAPSIDRIDSKLGYVKGNIQIISWRANTMKSNATKEELLLFANWVKNNLVDVPKVPNVPEVL